MTAAVLENLGLLAEAPGGVERLRALVLEMAAIGRLFGIQRGWRATELRELVTNSAAGWSPSCEARPRRDDEWGVLKVSAVSWGQFRPGENKALPLHLDPRPELEVQRGDFLVSRANTAELVARSVVVKDTPPKLMLSDKIVRLRLVDGCHPRFVQIVNSAPAARRYYARVAGGTSSSMKNVSREQILDLPILMPPLPEQHRIVAKVDELMALCDRLEARQQDAEAAHARLVQALLDSLTQARDADEFQACWLEVAEQFHMLFTTDDSLDALKQAVLQAACSGRLIGAVAPVLAEPVQRYLAAEANSIEAFSLLTGWHWIALGELCTLVTSGSRGWKEFYADQGATFIRSQAPRGRIVVVPFSQRVTRIGTTRTNAKIEKIN